MCWLIRFRKSDKDDCYAGKRRTYKLINTVAYRGVQEHHFYVRVVIRLFRITTANPAPA